MPESLSFIITFSRDGVHLVPYEAIVPLYRDKLSL